MTKRLIFFLTSLWWGGTATIDFAVVPTVFRVIDDFFNAGELGIALFSKFNELEILVSTLLLGLCAYELKTLAKGKLQFTLVFCGWMIVLVYITYLTPKISHLTTLWKAADLQNTLSMAGIADIQQEHQFYHRIYVGLDTIKLLILSTLLGNSVRGLHAKT